MSWQQILEISLNKLDIKKFAEFIDKIEKEYENIVKTKNIDDFWNAYMKGKRDACKSLREEILNGTFNK